MFLKIICLSKFRLWEYIHKNIHPFLLAIWRQNPFIIKRMDNLLNIIPFSLDWHRLLGITPATRFKLTQPRCGRKCTLTCVFNLLKFHCKGFRTFSQVSIVYYTVPPAYKPMAFSFNLISIHFLFVSCRTPYDFSPTSLEVLVSCYSWRKYSIFLHFLSFGMKNLFFLLSV